MKGLTFYRDTFFNRLILSYTALAVVLLGLAGGYLYTQANQMMVDEIARDSQSTSRYCKRLCGTAHCCENTKKIFKIRPYPPFSLGIALI